MAFGAASWPTVPHTRYLFAAVPAPLPSSAAGRRENHVGVPAVVTLIDQAAPFDSFRPLCDHGVAGSPPAWAPTTVPTLCAPSAVGIAPVRSSSWVPAGSAFANGPVTWRYATRDEENSMAGRGGREAGSGSSRSPALGR